MAKAFIESGQCDLNQQTPSISQKLNPTQRRSVVQSFASAWHEGWTPNREDVENLTNKIRGAIDREGYMRRTRETAERHRKAEAATLPRPDLGGR
jgi:hypothetical protein